MIINNDSLTALKEIEDNSIDAVITDPPFGYSFMGKSWDKAVPSVEIWQECLRVLKPGGWCMVMSAPRSDVQNAMISRLMEAGFRLDFTPIYWTYASGFPKAGNVGKIIDKRLGLEREQGELLYKSGKPDTSVSMPAGEVYETKPASDQAKALDGSYTGFQPKPAVEVIIVAMKPLSEKTYVDQALKNGKGITWLDDCRVGTGDGTTKTVHYPDIRGDNYAQGKGSYSEKRTVEYQVESKGRFPANLVVEHDVLGDHSKFFSLDAWADTLPFLAVPKASKSEKNKGLEHFEEQSAGGMQWNKSDRMIKNADGTITPRKAVVAKNHHPTVKPLKLMSYLITLTTREGDTVLDPFVGSGTTVVAANSLNRKGIGIEREEEYAEIARARVEANRPEPQLPLGGVR